MRRTALALACSFVLPLPALASDAVMQQWRAYAQRAVTPDFAWAAVPAVRAPSVLDAPRDALVRDTVDGTVLALTPIGALSFASSGGRFGFTPAQQDTQLLQSLSPLASRYAATTLVTPLGQDSRLSLTAIVAHQRYLTQGFGSGVWQGEPQQIGVARMAPSGESSHGSGVRLALEQNMGGSLDWSLTLQSRLEMDAFKTYRGVYSEPGDFDVPGFVQTGLRWSPNARLQLSLEAQRVFYSDVPAFTSAALPVSLLSLLGDGGAPEFAWRDLTVYAVEAAHRFGADSRVSLRYSTQQQPRPTSALLDRALQPLYSDTHVALGFQRGVGALGRLQFAASYSPTSYFFAAAPYVQREFDDGSQIEVEANWTIPF